MPFDIDPPAIPAEKRPDGEAVPEVVHARPGVIARTSQPDLARQAPEDTMNILMQQSTTALGDKEVRATARSQMSITPLGVAEQGLTGRRVQGHEARLAELALSNRQHALVEVDVAALQADRFGQAQTRHRDQPEQAIVGPPAQAVAGGRVRAAASNALIWVSL